MAAGTDSADQSRSCGGSDPEDGELVAGSDLEDGEFVAGPDDDIRHHVGDGFPEIKRRRLEFDDGVVVVDGGALPSPAPSCERDSDETISDVDADADADADAGAASLAQELLFPCPVCRREFTSQNSVNAHMNAHRGPHGRLQGNKERTPEMPASSGGWAVTGKRGSVGGRSVSSESQGVVDSVLDPMPIAFAFPSRSSSAEPNPPNDDSMATLVASSDNPTNRVGVHPPCSPQFLQGHQPAAPPVLVAQAQPTVAQGQQLADEAARQFVVHQAAAPQVVAHRTSPPPPARDEQAWWLFKEKGGDQRFATHQGLGGHMAGHKIRENNEFAAAGLHLGVGDAACAKPAKLYPCKHCSSVFTSGKQLGGHVSKKHYGGNVTPKKPGARPEVSAREVASAPALSLPMPPATMEATPAQPAVAPSAPVVVRIFGVNIVTTPPAAAANGTSSVVTETDQSSGASTNIEQ